MNYLEKHIKPYFQFENGPKMYTVYTITYNSHQFSFKQNLIGSFGKSRIFVIRLMNCAGFSSTWHRNAAVYYHD